MSESEDIINLILIEDNVIETLEEDDESHLIMIESKEESDILSDEDTKLIFSKLKGKFLNEAIASYKNKCCQYIEQRKAE